MTQKLYCIFDLVGDEAIVFGNGLNDSDFVRKNLAWIMKSYPLRDIEIRYTGFKVDMSSGTVTIDDIDEMHVVPWSAYEFPKNRVENLTSVGLEVPETIAKQE